MTFEDFARSAIRVPFLIGGRDYTGWDCWGLVYVAFRDVVGVDIGDYSSEYRASVTYRELAALIDRERPAWVQVAGKIKNGDVSLYRVGKYETHVGLIVNRRLLHCESGVNTVLEDLETPVWSKRHVNYYRHSALT